MINIEKNQYVLSSCELSLPALRHVTIGKNHLYADERLPVKFSEDRVGAKTVLIGYAFCIDQAGKSPEEDISLWDGNDLLALTGAWTGRFAVITERELCTDAGSMLSAFYVRCDGEWYVSSSLALLEQLGVTHKTRIQKLGETAWQILPETGFEGTKKLLCTEKICFSEHDVSICPHIWMRDFRDMTTEKKAERLAALLTNGVTNMERHSNRKLYVALTGGKDSRLVLAALLSAGVPFSAYTAEHGNISSSDVKIPKNLAEKYAFPHMYIKRPKHVNKDLALHFEAFTAGNAHGEDERFYSYGQFAKIPSNALIIRGGFFEAGQTYARSIARADGNFVSDMEKYYPALKSDELQCVGLCEWAENAQKNPIPYVDIRDRYYIEQRVGGWGSAIEQALSINDFVSVQIANCAELLSVLLSCNDREREKLALSFEPIRLLKEELLQDPFNAVSWSDKMKRVLSILKSPVSKMKKLINKSKIKRS